MHPFRAPSTAAASFAAALLLVVRPAQALAPPSAGTQSEKPNVVVILADDLGYGDLACTGGWIRTPNLDAFAAQSVTFTQAYAPAPICTPSRAGFFTGRSPAALGVQADTGPNKAARKHAKGLPGEAVLLSERLKELGYHSGLIGKWHLGLKEGMEPHDQGFDEYFGFLGASHAYLGDSPDAKMTRDDTLEEELEHEYLTDAFAREAEAFLERNKERAFVLTVAFNAPHAPYEASEAYLKRFPNMKGTKQVYAAMVSALDDAVGRILVALEKHGLGEKTLVFFASDNGAPMEDCPGTNKPLLLGKGYLFEGGVRVPLLLRWPGKAAPATKISAPVSLLDVAATTMKLAGASPQTLAEVEGRDLAPLLAGEAPAERAFFWKAGATAALRRGNWKVIASKGSRWLFDLETDPGEQNDLAQKEPERLAALNKELETWSAGLPEPLWANEVLDAPARVLGKPYWLEF